MVQLIVLVDEKLKEDFRLFCFVNKKSMGKVIRECMAEKVQEISGQFKELKEKYFL